MLALISSLILSAFATTPITYQYTTSMDFQLIGLEKPQNSYVSTYIDYVRDEISVNVMEVICPPNPVGPTCKAADIARHSFKAGMIKVEAGLCGAVFLIAERDDRPVDGDAVKIVVVDNSAFSCPSVRPQASSTTHVTQQFYDRINGEMVTNKVNARNYQLNPISQN